MTKIVAAFLFAFVMFSCNKSNNINTYFEDKTLRIDYYHVGNATLDSVKLDEAMVYGVWAGSRRNLIDTLKYGTYTHKVYDVATGVLLYSRGFDSYFKEYQLSTAALKGEVKVYHESALVPFPKNEIYFVLEKRLPSGERIEVYKTIIQPSMVKEVIPQDLVDSVRIYHVQNNGDASVKADVVIVGEGYAANEIEKFEADLHRFSEAFFNVEPCKSARSRFNVYGVLRASKDSGVDEPLAGIDKNTAVNATFNSLGSERYLLTEDNKALRNIASHVPYDAIYIMVNHSRYGGGGIYNFYCTFTADNTWSEYLMVHEFGHSFFGLADEYYSSSTAYEDFYPQNYEPAEANITAETDSSKVKWRHLFTAGIQIPTPWEKAEYDSVDRAWQAERTLLNKTILELQKAHAPDKEVIKAKATYENKSIENALAGRKYLEESPFFGKVGLFEGAGYASTGLYRSSVNCIMFTRTDYFCPVCQEAMKNVIQWYAQ